MLERTSERNEKAIMYRGRIYKPNALSNNRAEFHYNRILYHAPFTSAFNLEIKTTQNYTKYIDATRFKVGKRGGLIGRFNITSIDLNPRLLLVLVAKGEWGHFLDAVTLWNRRRIFFLICKNSFVISKNWFQIISVNNDVFIVWVLDKLDQYRISS